MRARFAGRAGAQAEGASIMTVTRRRFLSIAASFAAAPAFAFSGQHSWQGRAFGAEIEITLTGPRDKVRQALHQARGIIRQMEARCAIPPESSPGKTLANSPSPTSCKSSIARPRAARAAARPSRISIGRTMFSMVVFHGSNVACWNIIPIS